MYSIDFDAWKKADQQLLELLKDRPKWWKKCRDLKQPYVERSTYKNPSWVGYTLHTRKGGGYRIPDEPILMRGSKEICRFRHRWGYSFTAGGWGVMVGRRYIRRYWRNKVVISGSKELNELIYSLYDRYAYHYKTQDAIFDCFDHHPNQYKWNGVPVYIRGKKFEVTLENMKKFKMLGKRLEKIEALLKRQKLQQADFSTPRYRFCSGVEKNRLEVVTRNCPEYPEIS